MLSLLVLAGKVLLGLAVFKLAGDVVFRIVDWSVGRSIHHQQWNTGETWPTEAEKRAAIAAIQRASIRSAGRE